MPKLADKVIIKLKELASAGNPQEVADWIAKCGLIINGADFEQCVAVVQFLDDAEIRPVADALGVAA
jgi:hypothetical protein